MSNAIEFKIQYFKKYLLLLLKLILLLFLGTIKTLIIKTKIIYLDKTWAKIYIKTIIRKAIICENIFSKKKWLKKLVSVLASFTLMTNISKKI